MNIIARIKVEKFYNLNYTMKKSFIISGVAFALMIICGVAYKMSSNYVAEDGILVEAFGFIPLGWLFAFV
jgi:hypothetical protein